MRPFAASDPNTTEVLRREQIIALPAPMASDLGISFGAPIQIETDTRVVRVPIGVALEERDVGTLAASPVAIAPLQYVQRISGMRGRVTRIFIHTRPGQKAAVANALRDLDDGAFNVRDADADIGVFEAAAYPTKQSTMLFSMLSALVGFLFGLSAVLLTTPYRRS